MNNLHRELAPISSGAWTQIEEEAARTLKRYLAARRVVDVNGPGGSELSAIGTGHQRPIKTLTNGVVAAQREVKPLVQLRAAFELTREAIDAVERGSQDSDWSPLKEAARKIAFAEDRAVFEGYADAGIQGVRQVTSNRVVGLPKDVSSYPDAIAQAVNQLRLAGVNGPYALLLGAEPFTAINAASDDGYPVLKHIQQLVDKEIIWSPAIEGGVVLTTRGGDFDLYLGQDISIGYLTHSGSAVELYLQETFTFVVQTAEAAVMFAPPKK